MRLPGAPQDLELPVFLRDRQWSDLSVEATWEAEVARLAATLTGRALRGPWIDEGRERSYRGLQSFTEADAGWMFGREEEEAKLLDALRGGDRFITVVGASGSGKSSLIRAGVVPAVRTGAIDGRQRWHALVMRPGARPCHTLALRLLELQRTIEGRDTDVAQNPNRLKALREGLVADESRCRTPSTSCSSERTVNSRGLSTTKKWDSTAVKSIRAVNVPLDFRARILE